MEENKILGTEKNIEESGKDDRSAKIKKIFSIIGGEKSAGGASKRRKLG